MYILVLKEHVSNRHEATHTNVLCVYACTHLKVQTVDKTKSN